MGKEKVTETAARLIEPFLAEHGLELYDVRFVKEGRDRFLRVFIDKAQNGPEELYVGTEDCELVARYLSDRLDEEDPIEQNYYLEVSSPGMDRELFRDKDFVRYTGRDVEISLYKAVNGRKKLAGRLEGLEDGVITITTEDGQRIGVDRADAAKVNLAVTF